MRNRTVWLSAALCLLASGCAVAPRWPSAVARFASQSENDRQSSGRSLIDAWDDQDELRPYERPASLAVEPPQAKHHRAAVAELEPGPEPETEPAQISDDHEDARENTEPVADGSEAGATDRTNANEPVAKDPATDGRNADTPSAAEPNVDEPKADEPKVNEPGINEATAGAEPMPEVTACDAPVALEKPVVQAIDEAYLDTVAQPYGAATQYLDVHDSREEITTPEAAERSKFRYGDGEDDLDRFNRRVQDVPLDPRPIEGTMPAPLEVAEHPDHPRWVDVEEGDGMPLTVVSYTPWTFCYRPLYFEEINLERYGCTAGLVQPGLSGVHFFGSVLLMPYKMAVWPPRSCVCSNGFSRCEDCRPPGYRECVWSWRAAAVEAGVIAGIAVSLPW